MDEAKGPSCDDTYHFGNRTNVACHAFASQSANCKVRATVAVCVADIIDQALTESQEGSEVSDGSFPPFFCNPSVLFVQCCVHSSMNELLLRGCPARKSHCLDDTLLQLHASLSILG